MLVDLQFQTTEYLQFLSRCLSVGRTEVHWYLLSTIIIDCVDISVGIITHVVWDVMVDCEWGWSTHHWVVHILQHLVVRGGHYGDHGLFLTWGIVAHNWHGVGVGRFSAACRCFA